MFWSGNYNAVRELNFLLKQENVTLTQVLEADDILQECKADNKALMQFLTKPKILAELITLITEEPPKNVELASQYRHASIACEVLTSRLSTLSDRLSMDVVQMNRLCDFINKDPPLNPLLASYFSKTVEMLLERSHKQDWYLYHVVCLRVLDFFKSRRDFLPNLLRHISTSAIADTFKYFIRLDDLFNKIIMEWFEEHQFLECLIQIICGTYVPEPLGTGAAGAGAEGAAGAERKASEAERSPDRPEKGQHEASEKASQDHDTADDPDRGSETVENNARASPAAAEVGRRAAGGAGEGAAQSERARRLAGVASANAAALLCDLILSGCAGESCNTRPRTAWALVSRLQSGSGVRLVLQGMFTAPAHARAHALVHGAHVLRALLDQEPGVGGECESERTSVELAVAPHLPLLHQALLQAPGGGSSGSSDGSGSDGSGGRVGLPRVQVAALLAHLAMSEVEEVATTMLTLGTPGVVVDMMFAYPHNNFLHAQAAALVAHALANRVYRTQYARHLLVECDLLTRLMDVFEENENAKNGSARCAYMGHVVSTLRRVRTALEQDACELPPPLADRWRAFRDAALDPLLQRHDTPLGGYHPSKDIYEIYDVTATAGLDMPNDINADAYNEMCGATEPPDFMADELDLEDGEKHEGSRSNFLELASQRFDDDMWEDSPEADCDGEAEGEGAGEADDDADEPAPLSRVRELLEQPSPWESAAEGIAEGLGLGAAGGDAPGWAQFDAFDAAPAAPAAPAAAPASPAPGAPDPFAPAAPPKPAPVDQFATFWTYDSEDPEENSQRELEANMRSLSLEDGLEKMDDASSVELANKLLTAMSSMAPEVVADLVNSMSDSAHETQETQEAHKTQEPHETQETPSPRDEDKGSSASASDTPTKDESDTRKSDALPEADRSDQEVVDFVNSMYDSSHEAQETQETQETRDPPCPEPKTSSADTSDTPTKDESDSRKSDALPEADRTDQAQAQSESRAQSPPAHR